MGARPEQQLTLNFLTVVHDLWLQHPGNYIVEENVDDLVPALAQMCIKALAADVRDGSPRADQETAIDGRLLDGAHPRRGDGAAEPLIVRDVLNKIIHGTPTSVVVRDGVVQLHFKNSSSSDGWTEAWFSGTGLLEQISRILIKHNNDQARAREQQISRFLEMLGKERFLPSKSR